MLPHLLQQVLQHRPVFQGVILRVPVHQPGIVPRSGIGDQVAGHEGGGAAGVEQHKPPVHQVALHEEGHERQDQGSPENPPSAKAPPLRHRRQHGPVEKHQHQRQHQERVGPGLEKHRQSQGRRRQTKGTITLFQPEQQVTREHAEKSEEGGAQDHPFVKNLRRVQSESQEGENRGEGTEAVPRDQVHQDGRPGAEKELHGIHDVKIAPEQEIQNSQEILVQRGIAVVG